MWIVYSVFPTESQARLSTLRHAFKKQLNKGPRAAWERSGKLLSLAIFFILVELREIKEYRKGSNLFSS